jgi:hypothetical protein
MASVPLGALKVLKGADKLSRYQWNTRAATHFFCPECGIYTHHHQRQPPSMVGFNVACLEGVDPYALGEIPVSNGALLSSVSAEEQPTREPK